MDQEIAVQELAPGTIINDQYEIRALVAHGGMGAVYSANNLSGNFDVALKFLHQQFQRDKSYVKRFEREIDLLRTISHPNVVKIFHYGEYQKQIYYVMELVHGTCLDTLIEQDRVQTETLSHIVLQLCDGLSAIHTKGVVHRDIRPSNIMLMSNLSPKIIDFSIAWRSDMRLTQSNVRLGALEYIAPEIWAGDMPTPYVDQYGLGITLYELILGKTPYEATDMESLMTFHERQSIPPLRSFDVKLPIWFEHMVEKMVSKIPMDRFESMAEISRYIRKHDESARAIQRFSGSMAAGTYRDGENMLTVFQSLSETTDTVVRKQNEMNAILLSAKKEKLKSGKLIGSSSSAPKTIVIKLPGRGAMQFEIPVPSLDYLFLGGFLISLNVFDAYLTNEGVSRLGTNAERNILLKELMEQFGSRNVLVFAKLLAFCFAIYLTYLSHKSKHVRLIVAALSLIYLTCAVAPWIYLLYYSN